MGWRAGDRRTIEAHSPAAMARTPLHHHDHEVDGVPSAGGSGVAASAEGSGGSGGGVPSAGGSGGSGGGGG